MINTGYSYDLSHRLETITHHDAGANLPAGYQWFYDESNRVTRFFSSNDGTADYYYDGLGQLETADYNYQTDEEYLYDENGNRLAAVNANGSYLHDNPGPRNRLTSDGLYEYAYYDEGMLAARTDLLTGDYTLYSYDHKNRLTEVEEFSDAAVSLSKAHYLYDVYDRRVAKRIDADGAGTGGYVTTAYAYDGAHIALQFDDDAKLSHRYLHGPAIDQLLADEQVDWDSSGAQYVVDDLLWALSDNLGTVRDLAKYDSSTNTAPVVNHRTFDAFGQVLSELDPATSAAAALTTSFAFTGRELDDESGLYFYRARYYDPVTGRFLSEDPIADDEQNSYRYVGNGPTNKTDPSGLFDWWFNWFRVSLNRRNTAEGLDRAVDQYIEFPQPGRIMPTGGQWASGHGTRPHCEQAWCEALRTEAHAG